MSKIITIDTGNTNTSIGVWEGEELIETFRISSDLKKTADEYGVLIFDILNHKKITELEGGIISSVVPQLGEILKSAVSKYLKIAPVNLSYKSKMPVTLKLDNNSELGADRIANAAAAAIKYSLPAIVIDFGTATSFDIVDDKGCFIGGIITPGVEIQARALSQFTSKLPKLKIESPKETIGKNTISAMLSGIVEGHRCLIEGLIEKCEKELSKKATIILTGGLSPVLFGSIRHDYTDENLTLFGLKELYKMNKENS